VKMLPALFYTTNQKALLDKNQSVEQNGEQKKACNTSHSQPPPPRYGRSSSDFMNISLNLTILKESPVSPNYFLSVCYTGLSSFPLIMDLCN
jgi:hypothetical protein